LSCRIVVNVEYGYLQYLSYSALTMTSRYNSKNSEIATTIHIENKTLMINTFEETVPSVL